MTHYSDNLLGNSMDSESELISLISRLLFLGNSMDLEFKLVSLISQIISMVSPSRRIDLNSQPKPETEFMSLITQAISVFYSMDFDSQPKPLLKFISLIFQETSFANFMDLFFNIENIITLEPEPELVSLIYQIFSFVISMESKSGKFISLCPQKQVRSEKGKFHVSVEEAPWHTNDNKWACLPWNWMRLKFLGEEETRFYCTGCGGKNHEEYKMVPVEIKHNLHRKHSLQLVMLEKTSSIRKCYCGDEYLKEIFYYCEACDFAINMVCVVLLSIDHPKWHEHTLHLFPRHESLTCSLCAVADATSHIYMCPNCAFVVHVRCIDLPRVIRISRHRDRISFTHFLDHGDSSCGVCRRKIDNDYGGYSCIKDGCSYAAHSRCATQKNVWDGVELEGEPEEENTEDIKPFVRISDGIIQHFSHKHHYLKLDKNTGRDYDDNQQCQACITPIYFGNFYSCMECDFILHKKCANLSSKIYHPIHPHLLTLGYENVSPKFSYHRRCTACPNYYTAGFLYKCGEKGCDFQLHVQCATVSDPLVHESHMHHLFLTSKPGEKQRICSVCKEEEAYVLTNETFNCIEECDFALCFGCATLPQKVRYKHDKHVLTLSYGNETSTMTYWCELCERRVDPQKRFYMCDEYCCVTLHIECLLGKDLYMKPGSSWFLYGKEVQVLPNNRHMTRPICCNCEQRCSQKIFLQSSGSISCSVFCLDKLAKISCNTLELDGLFSGLD